MEKKTLALDALVIGIIIIGGILIYHTLPTENKPITITTTPMHDDNTTAPADGSVPTPPATPSAPTSVNPLEIAAAVGESAIAPLSLPVAASEVTASESTGKIAVIEGVKIETKKEGTGREAIKGDTIAVHYQGMLTDGKVFDSSMPRGEPLVLVLGGGQVIRGWEVGLLGMKVGEERKLTIPGSMAYGESGYPGVIPPNATLVFDVQLVGIK